MVPDCIRPGVNWKTEVLPLCAQLALSDDSDESVSEKLTLLLKEEVVAII